MMIDFGEVDDINIFEIQPIINNEEPPNNVPRRHIRDTTNPFNRFSELEFRKRFRFPKFYERDEIFPKIQAGLERESNRGHPISPIFELLICLRYLATNSFQKVIGDLMDISQSAVSNIVFRVTLLLAALFDRYVSMPHSLEILNNNRRLFRELGADDAGRSLPNVDGLIDCTHIKLQAVRLGEYREVYRNRKGYFSLNVQVIVGPRTEILDIVPEWPGSEHDSRIFQNSRLYVRYTEGEFGGTLVGDSGYPSLPFVLTPANPERSPAERRYNRVHVKTRRLVEQTFGIWKREFPVLSSGLRTKLICNTNTISACVVLHNMRLVARNILPNFDDERNEERILFPPPCMAPGNGLAVRNRLIQQIFN